MCALAVRKLYKQICVQNDANWRKKSSPEELLFSCFEEKLLN
jgi:hypothetical protein